MSYQSERLREIANQRLTHGSKEWAELMQISGYIEGLEEGRELLKGAGKPTPTETSHLAVLSKYSAEPCGDGDGDPGPSSQRRYESDYDDDSGASLAAGATIVSNWPRPRQRAPLALITRSILRTFACPAMPTWTCPRAPSRATAMTASGTPRSAKGVVR